MEFVGITTVVVSDHFSIRLPLFLESQFQERMLLERSQPNGVTSTKWWYKVGRRVRTYGSATMNGKRRMTRHTSRITKRGKWMMNKGGNKERTRSAGICAVYGDHITDDAGVCCWVLDRCWGVRRR